eukprot:TRINITY_DN52305_c0_g1_i1.p1 TRINITY_DN52305_c0_g1~~TRINITY_DN52305_c0_g1_i1.p1  ORF type:complete len:503 (+),score=60.26 TRINITY_DN52305_c0_g1_i1:46-1554(+)
MSKNMTWGKLFVALPISSAFHLWLPVSLPGNNSVWKMSWDVEQELATEVVNRLEATHGGEGLRFRLQLGNLDYLLPRGGKEATLRQARHGEYMFLKWKEVAGFLHQNLVSATLHSPDIALQAELRPYRAPRRNYKRVKGVDFVGLFLALSPHRSSSVLVQTLRYAYRLNLLPRVRLHVLVHTLSDWQPEEFEASLVEAGSLLGGFHWCEGVNRYYNYNPGLLKNEYWLRDNYFHKMYVALTVAVFEGFTYFASLDDDVMLSPSTMSWLLMSGPHADKEGCAITAPLLQNNPGSVELWAEHWLNESARSRLFNCFAGCSGYFCRPEYLACSGSSKNSFKVPVPSPWSASDFYEHVQELASPEDRVVHPVYSNSTCTDLALALALDIVPDTWMTVHTPIVKPMVGHQYTYIRNNAYLSRTDFYTTVIRHPGNFGMTRDELALNIVMKEQNKTLCFLEHSFGIHPAWSVHGAQKLRNMERNAEIAVRNAMFKTARDYAVKHGLKN